MASSNTGKKNRFFQRLKIWHQQEDCCSNRSSNKKRSQASACGRAMTSICSLEYGRSDQQCGFFSLLHLTIIALIMLVSVSFYIYFTTLNQKDDQPVVLGPSEILQLDADYYFDYYTGTTTLGDLPIGTRVADPTWLWEFRTGNDYTAQDNDEIKPVTWIIVAKDHYPGLEPHVTLLAEELIGKHSFDDSKGRGYIYDRYGYNHWGDSGTDNARRGVRPWLNSTGIHSHSNEGFYQAFSETFKHSEGFYQVFSVVFKRSQGFYQTFSENFKEAILTTRLPNRKWKDGSFYVTDDSVFIPSSTELGDSNFRHTYQIGTVYPYFAEADNADRVALLGEDTVWYWTRSPHSSLGYSLRFIYYGGQFVSVNYMFFANYSGGGIRPAVNLSSQTLVSEIRDEQEYLQMHDHTAVQACKLPVKTARLHL